MRVEMGEVGRRHRRHHQLLLAHVETSRFRKIVMAAAHQPHCSRFLAMEDLWARTLDHRAE
jgi:hypothetical protein